MTVTRVAWLTLACLSACMLLTSPGWAQQHAPKPSTGFRPVDDQAEAQLADRSPAARQQRQRALSDALETAPASPPSSEKENRQSRPPVAHISLSLKDADLQEVLRSFARLADVNLVLDPSVEGKVTVELHDVPWDQALAVILKSHRLGAQLNGRIWRVGAWQ